jgi:hypothetical protein
LTCPALLTLAIKHGKLEAHQTWHGGNWRFTAHRWRFRQAMELRTAEVCSMIFWD